MNLFAHKGRSIESIPLTYDALMQHVNRVIYQAGFCWNLSLNKIQDLPSPSERGWMFEEDHWEPYWTELPEEKLS